MEKNEDIEIMTASNGFIVRSLHREYKGTAVPLPTEAKVFQTFSELTKFLDEHFSHRCKTVKAD